MFTYLELSLIPDTLGFFTTGVSRGESDLFVSSVLLLFDCVELDFNVLPLEPEPLLIPYLSCCSGRCFPLLVCDVALPDFSETRFLQVANQLSF